MGVATKPDHDEHERPHRHGWNSQSMFIASPGRADFLHPVLHERDSLAAAYPWKISMQRQERMTTLPTLCSRRARARRWALTRAALMDGDRGVDQIAA
jgi:hypothetical protein